MKKVQLIILLTLIGQAVSAQFIKQKEINVSAGFGLSAPYEDVDIYGSGFFAQGELVLTAASWVDFRPYAGIIFTSDTDDENSTLDPSFKSTANAFLGGVKSRLRAPIPWVAPYIEIGVGFSIGSFETFTPSINIEKSGVLFHIPFSIGLELGKNHNVDFRFTYCYHDAVEQFAGAAAVGVTFPLK
ncbi:hypothetical protein [Winogradskyella sp. A3E31]|uniref:hypothetical protein n=1 Tax=Winogradskyella sp. A3E31 TaxID=3349637 RepID=UPI00398A559B